MGWNIRPFRDDKNNIRKDIIIDNNQNFKQAFEEALQEYSGQEKDQIGTASAVKKSFAKTLLEKLGNDLSENGELLGISIVGKENDVYYYSLH